MSNDLVTGDFFGEPEESPSGASDRRGTTRFTEVAKDFVKLHPVNTILTATELDRWLNDQQLLVVPPEGTAKNDDKWMGHLQRRHIVIGRINKSATHPRMRDPEHKSACFVIVSRGGQFHVKAPQEVILEGELAKKVQSLCVTGRKNLRFLMESADWPALPAHDRAIAESIDDDLDLFEEHIASSTRMLSKKLGKLQKKIKHAVEAGEIKPKNGGIGRFLAPPGDDEGPQ